MRVVVDFELCESNALCVEQAPQVFRVDEDDQLQILMEKPGSELRERVEAAARLCPRQAITILETD